MHVCVYACVFVCVCVLYTKPPLTAALRFTNTILNSKCLCFYKALRQVRCEEAPRQQDKEKELNRSIVPPTHTHGMTLRPLNHLCECDLRSAEATLLCRPAAPPVICPCCSAISLSSRCTSYRISRRNGFTSCTF